MTVPDRIEREIVVGAPIERVWRLVTEPEHLGRWFGETAELDLRPGGEGLLTWQGHPSARMRVVSIEPPRRFAFRWIRGGASPPVEGNETLVEFLLDAADGGTRVRVVEHGFPDLDRSPGERARYAEENTVGWGVELAELRSYAARVR
jgi:uncharacterized protein YndB with AHSA1/START domain